MPGRPPRRLAAGGPSRLALGCAALLWLALAAFGAAAQPAGLEIAPGVTEVNRLDTIFLDLDRDLPPTFEEVSQALLTPRLTLGDVTDPVVARRVFPENNWLVLPITNRTGQAQAFKFDTGQSYSRFEKFYLLRAGEAPFLLYQGDFISDHFSERIPNERLISSRWFTLEDGETAIVLFSARRGWGVQNPVHIVDKDSYARTRAGLSSFVGGMFAFRVAFIVFIFAFALILRSRTALYYGLLSAAVGAFLAGEYGFLYAGPLGNPDLDYAYNESMILLIYAFYTLGTRSFFHLGTENRLLGRICIASLLAAVVVSILANSDLIGDAVGLPFNATPLSTEISIYAAGGIVLANLAAAVWGIWKRKPGSSLFLLGGVLLFYNMNTYLFPVPRTFGDAAVNLANVGFAVDMLIFTAALIMQTLNLRHDRDRAAAAELAATTEKLHALEARRAAEQDRDDARRLADRHRERLLATSHDLRQPLTSLQLALQNTEGGGAELRQKLETGLAYLNALLAPGGEEEDDPADGHSGMLRPDDPEAVPLQIVFDNLARMFGDEAAARGLALRFRPTDLCVLTDPVGLIRTLSNLIANAVRYTAHGRILVAARRRGETVSIEVRDTGPGLEPADLSRILMQGERGANAEDVPGEGLGLAIVQDWADRMGLGFTAASTPGRGSLFALRGLALSQDTSDALVPPQEQAR